MPHLSPHVVVEHADKKTRKKTKDARARPPSVAHLGQPLRQSDEALQLPRGGADGLGAPAHHVAHVQVPLDQ